MQKRGHREENKFGWQQYCITSCYQKLQARPCENDGRPDVSRNQGAGERLSNIQNHISRKTEPCIDYMLAILPEMEGIQ
jgi:hypothetical protein